MRSRPLIAGLALIAAAAACSPNDDGTAGSSTPTAPTAEARPQPTSGPTVAATTAPVTGSSEPPSDTVGPTADATTIPLAASSEPPVETVPIDPDLPLGGPVPPGAPEVVAERALLPYCGAAFVHPSIANPFEGIDMVDDARDCYRRRAEAGLPVEMIEILSTIEGDPVLIIRRLLPDGREEQFWDLTRDALGAKAWFRYVCAGYQEICERSEQLASPDPAPAESTLFALTFAGHEPGPPFYVMAGRVVAAESTDDAWATHQITIVSESRTLIAVATPPPRYVLKSRGVFDPTAGELADTQPLTIRPGGSTELRLVLVPRFRTAPAPGVYEIRVPIAYWLDVDSATGPQGAAKGTLPLLVTYEVLDMRDASAVLDFCNAAVDAAEGLVDFDRQSLTRGIDEIDAAAISLPLSKREDLLTETSALRLDIEMWFGPEVWHGGFSTGRVIGIINRLCTTDLLALAVIA